MKNTKKLLSIILSVMIILATFAVFAAEETSAVYGEFTGIVKEITELDDKTMVWLENEAEEQATFVITADTIVYNDIEIKKDAEITGIYNLNAPMLMIYPPQYNVKVVYSAPKDSSVKVDLFDDELVSSDGTLKLNITDKTAIVLEDGTKADKDVIKNRTLIVEYSTATKSIPAIAVPSKITVLFEKVTSMPQEVEPEIELATYVVVSGKISSVDGDFVTVEDGEDVTVFVINDDTVLYGDVKIEVGALVAGVYDTRLPINMIYPPQYQAQAIFAASGDSFVKYDFFDEELVSSDGTLKLNNITDETEIVLQTGEKVDKYSIMNRTLIVEYTVSTKSIPAITTPSKVTVILGTVVPLPIEPRDFSDFETVDIVVNGNVIDAPAAFVNDDDIIMIPLRAVAEELGFEVVWNNDNWSISVGNILLAIDDAVYKNVETGAEVVEIAPKLKKGSTYVPLNFFRDMLAQNNAYFFEGQIDINNFEEMR